ncbi:MAG TPA: uroporphyrinogen decarboxylase family protein [Armatimonadota bacterium]|nr:uroporphyrinogen decarboxylase family protein [Armatimonadota bacterium]
MNHRERWVNTMHFRPVDYVPDEEFGYWDDTITVWHDSGLPGWVRNLPQADLYFGFSPRHTVPVHVGLRPSFEARVLEETDRHRIVLDGNGVKSVIYKDGTSSIPHYLDFSLKTRDDWPEFKKRLDPTTPGRYPSDWETRKKAWAGRDYALGIYCGSLFGWIRDWMSFERITVTCIDDPAWVHEMVEHLADCAISTIERALKEVDLDFAHFWEDMCYNQGPMISPTMFREFLVPQYKRITDLLHRHGVDVVVVDCDGDINQLVPLWLEAGVNAMFPIEVRAGTDPWELRNRFGSDVLLLGGVDKMKLIQGKAAIDEEIRRIAPLVEKGGYIPHVDHRVPPDVTWENYLYYLAEKRRVLGIPTPATYEFQEKTAVA